jgi:DNA invertase Pin-like site-specific DNA recombinase
VLFCYRANGYSPCNGVHSESLERHRSMKNEMRKWIAYYRVSTQRQGESGLGLDAQRTVVRTFLSGRGGEVVGEFTETESGKKASNRPQLQAAMDVCRKQRATLVIAKLDRLARNVHFISGLMESGVDFVAVDQPTKDRFMLHVQAAFAEEEARRISMRTKEALAAAKRRGTDIGATGRALAARHKAEALERARALAPVVASIRAEGFRKVREIRDQLNIRGYPSPGACKWHLPSVHRLLKRLESSP